MLGKVEDLCLLDILIQLVVKSKRTFGNLLKVWRVGVKVRYSNEERSVRGILLLLEAATSDIPT